MKSHNNIVETYINPSEAFTTKISHFAKLAPYFAEMRKNEGQNEKNVGAVGIFDSSAYKGKPRTNIMKGSVSSGDYNSTYGHSERVGLKDALTDLINTQYNGGNKEIAPPINLEYLTDNPSKYQELLKHNNHLVNIWSEYPACSTGDKKGGVCRQWLPKILSDSSEIGYTVNRWGKEKRLDTIEKLQKAYTQYKTNPVIQKLTKKQEPISDKVSPMELAQIHDEEWRQRHYGYLPKDYASNQLNKIIKLDEKYFEEQAKKRKEEETKIELENKQIQEKERLKNEIENLYRELQDANYLTKIQIYSQIGYLESQLNKFAHGGRVISCNQSSTNIDADIMGLIKANKKRHNTSRMPNLNHNVVKRGFKIATSNPKEINRLLDISMNGTSKEFNNYLLNLGMKNTKPKNVLDKLLAELE